MKFEKMNKVEENTKTIAKTSATERKSKHLGACNSDGEANENIVCTETGGKAEITFWNKTKEFSSPTQLKSINTRYPHRHWYGVSGNSFLFASVSLCQICRGVNHWMNWMKRDRYQQLFVFFRTRQPKPTTNEVANYYWIDVPLDTECSSCDDGAKRCLDLPNYVWLGEFIILIDWWNGMEWMGMLLLLLFFSKILMALEKTLLVGQRWQLKLMFAHHISLLWFIVRVVVCCWNRFENLTILLSAAYQITEIFFARKKTFSEKCQNEMINVCGRFNLFVHCYYSSNIISDWNGRMNGVVCVLSWCHHLSTNNIQTTTDACSSSTVWKRCLPCQYPQQQHQQPTIDLRLFPFILCWPWPWPYQMSVFKLHERWLR